MGFNLGDSIAAGSIGAIGTTPTDAANASPDQTEELFAWYHQQRMALTSMLTSMGESTGTGLGDALGNTGASDIPALTDPKGKAIDYLLGTQSHGNNAGDLFNLTLSPLGHSIDPAKLADLKAEQAEEAYQTVNQLVQAVEQAKQSNIDVLSEMASSSRSRDLSGLI